MCRLMRKMILLYNKKINRIENGNTINHGNAIVIWKKLRYCKTHVWIQNKLQMKIKNKICFVINK